MAAYAAVFSLSSFWEDRDTDPEITMEMTTKLYENEQNLASFTATVLSCAACEGGFRVVLDRTAFFPCEGGQGADHGTLGGVNVLDAAIEGGVVTHLVDAPLPVGATVLGEVDPVRRRRHMQVHTGEHILSGTLHAMYGATNVGFHLGETEVTLDIDLALSEAELAAAEEAANRAVFEDRAVRIHYPTPAELPSLSYRAKLDLTEGVRLVEIEGVDLCACCAPHVERTGEVGLIKIVSSMHYKGGTRLHIAVGPDALADYRQKQAGVHAVSVALSVPEEEIAAGVARLSEALAEERRTVAALRAALRAERLAAATAKGGDLCLFYPDLDAVGLRQYAEEGAAMTAGFVLVASPADGGYRYALAKKGGGARVLSASLHASLGGRGGGRDELCQGSVPATREAILAELGLS